MNKQVRYQLIKRNINWETTLGEFAKHLKFDLLQRLFDKVFNGKTPEIIDYREVKIGSLLINYNDDIIKAFEEIFNNLSIEDFKEYSLGKIIN